MTNPFPEFFRYCRSKGSAFGHSARRRDPVKAWLETKKFLDTYTDYELSMPLEITLRVANGEFDRKLYEDIVSCFGQPTKTDENWMRWTCDRVFDNDINEFILNHFKYASGYEYDLNIRLHFNFKWKILDQKLIDNNIEVFNYFFKKGNHGRFSVSIDNRLFIQPEFVVPLSNWDKFHGLINHLIEDLPFKFNEKSFISFYSKKLKNGKKSYKSLGYYSFKP